MQPPSNIGCVDHQLEAIQQATAILERRGGVLIADSVGLGKTFVGLGLIELALLHDQRVLVAAPAGLRRMWRTELNKILSTGASAIPLILSHSQLARGHGQDRDFDFIVVDEAHAFRNPRTRRYRALRRMCRNARVVLITATPVNNSLADLLFQLRLFCSDRAFCDLGIGSMRAALEENAHDCDRILRSVMIRRTRAEIRARADADPAVTGRTSLRFPARLDIQAVGYAMSLSPARVGELVATLTFPAHQCGPHRIPSVDLLRFGMLKRMESSAYAMRVTLARQIRFYEEFIAALDRGMLLRPATFRSMYDVGEDALQLVLEGVTLERPGTLPAGLHEAASRELCALRTWHRELVAAPDDKVAKLNEILLARPRDTRTVVFTEYRDTARYIWTALRRRFPTALIDGAGAWIGESPASRRLAIERFAPRANRCRAVHPREAVRVLVATDVLAEGMNLQDADTVISYDLPWNPMRLVQRAGRVDRMGSEHDVVTVYNFMPDREFDAFLGLARTIRKKVETVRSTVGLERPVFEPAEDVETVSRALRLGDADILDRIEGSTGHELRRRFQKMELVPCAGVPLAKMPDASGKRLLIGIRRATEWQEMSIQLQGGPAVPQLDADGILLRALDIPDVLPLDPEAVVQAANAAVSRLDRAGVDGGVERSSPASRAARLVRHRLAECVSDQDDALFHRADAVLAKLGEILHPEVEAEVGRIVGRTYETPADLLAALEAATGSAESNSHSGAWVFTAAIIAD